MQWAGDDHGNPILAVLPLHGRGNKNNEGEGVRFLGYRWPWIESNQPVVLFDSSAGLHATHNFNVTPLHASGLFVIATKEGLRTFTTTNLPQNPGKFLSDEPAGEVRLGSLGPQKIAFVATIEPMHGNRLAVTLLTDLGALTTAAKRLVLDESLTQGHALATGDLLGIGFDQIVVGWRGAGKPGEKVGIKLYAPDDATGTSWKLNTLIDDNQMACEDLKLADLNGDGRLDIIAAGRATKNVVIYWNESGKAK